MTAKRIILSFVILLCIFLAAAVWWARSGKSFFRKEASRLAPKVHVKKIFISDINDNTITMVLDALVENQLPTTLLVDSLDYDLYIGSEKVVEGLSTKKISVLHGGTESVKIPMKVKVERLRSIIRKFESEKKDSAVYTVNGDFRMKIPVAGMRKFTVNERRVLPAIREIHVKAGKMEFDKMGLKKSKMSMPVNVENHNAFPIKMKDGIFNMEIDHGIKINGSMQELVNIPARGSGVIDITINTKTLKLPKLGWKLLFKENRTHFRSHFTCIVMSDSEMMKECKMTINDEGTLAELKHFVKKIKD